MMRPTAICALLLFSGRIAAFTPSELPDSRQPSICYGIADDAEDGLTVTSLPPTCSRTMATTNRRSVVASLWCGMSSFPLAASAAPADCMTDCVKNCKIVVPQDTSNYCQDSCRDYCDQPDRRDGLSGSVSAEGGEVGILGGTFGQGTVVKGQDKPPQFKLPGLNFDSGEGKKLLG